MNKPNTPVQLPRWLTGLSKATGASTYMAGGGTGCIQGGAFAGGRAIDAMTGNRSSSVNKYIKKNTKSNRMTQLSPIGPSLVATIAEAQQAESAIEQQKMEEVELNRSLG